MSSIVKTFANRTATNYVDISGDKQAAIDAALIPLIEMLITGIIEIAKECIDARKARVAAGQPTIFQEWWMNRQIRRDADERLRHRQVVDLRKAMLKAVASATQEEVDALWAS